MSAPTTIKYHGQLYKRADSIHFPIITDFEVDKWLQQNGQRLGTLLAKTLLQAMKQADKIMLIPPDDVKRLALFLQWLLFSDPTRRTPPPAGLRGTPPAAPPSFQLLSLLENVMGESLSHELDESDRAERQRQLKGK